jgi:glyceraldehyde-3-phosphate dehydrogenase (NADP+)
MDTRGKLGFVMRIPCGVVLAITPFNFPFYLVIQKIGPALAAGNAVILKPASQTPLVALRLTELLLEAGLPELGIQTVTGSGRTVGNILCADSRVRKISFTGSREVGETLTRVAGIKRLSLELGANCPMIVLPDADLELAAQAASMAGYINAGQVCISLQRIIVHREVYPDFIDALKPAVESIKIGPPLEEDSRMCAMISPGEVDRVEAWIGEAVRDGARLVSGGDRTDATLVPTILAEVRPEMRVFREELFGPAVTMTPAESAEEAIALANRSDYGLAAGLFTRDVNQAMRFAKDAEAGSLHINWTPLWRADFMPYGGLKGSGIGKEGPRYAIEEMTDAKTIIVHGLE